MNQKREVDEIKVPEHTSHIVEESIKRAKAEKFQIHQRRRNSFIRSFALAIICIAVVLPNINYDVAQAMSNIPVVGNFFDAVTFRNYSIQEDGHIADVKIPKVITDQSSEKDADVAQSINKEIQSIVEEKMESFKQSLKDKTSGSTQLFVDYEIVNSTKDYFTLKLVTFESGASGYEEEYYYTIDISSGKEMSLADLFPKDADYINPISRNIIDQMREQINSGEAIYWVDLPEDDPDREFAFKTISESQDFYINESGNLVICFDEGEVAPMYMGCVKFIIPNKITKSI